MKKILTLIGICFSVCAFSQTPQHIYDYTALHGNMTNVSTIGDVQTGSVHTTRRIFFSDFVQYADSNSFYITPFKYRTDSLTLRQLINTNTAAIAALNVTNWNTAFSWGNHAGLYPLLTGSYANPAWITSLAYAKLTGAPTIPTNNNQLINGAGFLTTEVDPKRIVSVVISGTATKTVTITLADATTVTGTFTDQTGGAGGGITSLNGDNSSTQSFATGTTGTDFNIVTASGVHTFNIPTSSATKRGLLSSADWVTFNNKLSSESDPLALKITNNLSDINSAATARTNLGLGTAATQSSSAFEPANSNIQSHIASTSNPHNVTAAQAGALPITGGTLTGTGGVGYIGLKSQSTRPATPPAGEIREFVDSNNQRAYINSAGKTRSFNYRNNPTDAVYYFQNKTNGYTVADSADVASLGVYVSGMSGTGASASPFISDSIPVKTNGTMVGFAPYWVESTDSSFNWKIAGQTFKIKVNGGGGSSSSGTTLSAPSLTTSVVSSSAIDVTVGSVTNASSYNLDWSANGTSGWTSLATTSGVYHHTSLTASTPYYYRARAVGDGTTYLTSTYATANATTSAGGGGGGGTDVTYTTVSGLAETSTGSKIWTGPNNSYGISSLTATGDFTYQITYSAATSSGGVIGVSLSSTADNYTNSSWFGGVYGYSGKIWFISNGTGYDQSVSAVDGDILRVRRTSGVLWAEYSRNSGSTWTLLNGGSSLGSFSGTAYFKAATAVANAQIRFPQTN